MSKNVVPKLKLDIAISEIQTQYKLLDYEVIELLKGEIEKRE